MREKYIKISRLKVGDIFCYRNVIYEVVIQFCKELLQIEYPEEQ